MHQPLELGGAGHKIALAVHFQQNADLSPGVDVAGNDAFAGGAGCLLGGGGHATLAQHHDGLLQIAVGLGKGFLAVHHRGAGLFAELFNHCCGNLCHCKNLSWISAAGRAQAPGLLANQHNTDSRKTTRAEECSAGRFSRNIRECPLGLRTYRDSTSTSLSATAVSTLRTPLPSTSSMLRSSAARHRRKFRLQRQLASLAVTPAASSALCLSVAACEPSTTESAILEANRRMARSASSLPGMM